MDKIEIVQAFNNHLDEFFNDIILVFPNDVEIKTAKIGISAIKSMNPSLIIKIWHKYISLPYKNEIENGDIDFFLNKDYTNDLSNSENTSLILNKIDMLRDLIKQLGDSNLIKAKNYVQNLSKISYLYYN